MPDVATSPPPSTRKRPRQLLPSSTPPPPPESPTFPLFSLPPELVGDILLLSLEPHPSTCIQDDSWDPRSHGWKETTSHEKVKTYARPYHAQLLKLIAVSKSFYLQLLPELYSSPTLLEPQAIESFAQVVASTPCLFDPETTFGSLVKTFIVGAQSSLIPTLTVKTWKSHLPDILAELTQLESFAPAHYSLLLPFANLISSISLQNTLTSLDNVDTYSALYTDISATAQQQHNVLGLMARCHALRRVSFAGINLLENGYGHFQTNDSLMLPDEVNSWSSDDSVAERFLRTLKMGVSCGVSVAGEEEQGGIESLLFWENSLVGVGVLREILDLPRLRCLHLDVFSFVTPSATKSSFYKPLSKRLSLPDLIPHFARLTELTFAPLFSDSVTCEGNFDSILLGMPLLRLLELRCDHITPRFFASISAPGAAPLTYLALHVLPPHNPSYSTEAGSKLVSVTVYLWTTHEQVISLGQSASEVFGLVAGVEGGGVEWPEGEMEEGVTGAQSGWYDLLGRLASLAVGSRRNKEGEEVESD